MPPSFAKASAGGRSAYGGLANEIFVLGALASLEGTCAYCGLGGASPCRRRLNERKNPAWNAGLNMDSVSYPAPPTVESQRHVRVRYCGERRRAGDG